jgi:hypothetical protein
MSGHNQLSATFHGSGMRPQCPPDPSFPNGMPVDVSGGLPACEIALDHPAPCIGVWRVVCAACGQRIGVTAAGRPDDPSCLRIACRPRGSA